MELTPEFVGYLRNEVKAFDNELQGIKGLPSIDSLRSRIRKDKRDTKAMLTLYAQMTQCNKTIKAVKAEMRNCNEEAVRLLGHNLQRPKRKYVSSRDTSYDIID